MNLDSIDKPRCNLTAEKWDGSTGTVIGMNMLGPMLKSSDGKFYKPIHKEIKQYYFPTDEEENEEDDD